MNKLKTVTGGSVLLWACALAGGREPLPFLSTKVNPSLAKLRGPARSLLEARQLSEEVLYFFEVPEPIERGIELSSDGLLYFNKARHLGLGPRKIYQSGVLISERPQPGRDTLAEAASMYRQALKDLLASNRDREKKAVPFEFVGATLWPVSDVGYDLTKYDLEKVQQGYERNPSDLAALAYLELALVEKKLGNTGEYKKLLAEAVSKLELLNIHYCPDVLFREHLHQSLNFARPETCLVFLAGEDARLSARAPEARKYYTTLIERAPGSPFAWEALAKLVVMGDTDAEQVEWLKGILLHTYPLVWGCPRAEVKLEREEFAKQLSALLETAGKEKSGEKRPSQ